MLSSLVASIVLSMQIDNIDKLIDGIIDKFILLSIVKRYVTNSPA